MVSSMALLSVIDLREGTEAASREMKDMHILRLAIRNLTSDLRCNESFLI